MAVVVVIVARTALAVGIGRGLDVHLRALVIGKQNGDQRPMTV